MIWRLYKYILKTTLLYKANKRNTLAKAIDTISEYLLNVLLKIILV